MAKEKQILSRILRCASKYVGAGAGLVAVLGKGIHHACEKGAKLAGGLFAPRTRKCEECPGVATEPAPTTEPSEVTEADAAEAPGEGEGEPPCPAVLLAAETPLSCAIRTTQETRPKNH